MSDFDLAAIFFGSLLLLGLRNLFHIWRLEDELHTWRLLAIEANKERGEK